MQTLHERCCGLDVHKQSISACVRVTQGAEAVEEFAAFGTMSSDILRLGDWLEGHGVRHVAMESTGVYWKPIWNLLEERFELMLVNAQHIKHVPGRKTDMMDCQWIAQLLACGLLAPSFVPERPQRELRELTRHRATLMQEKSRLANRVQKVLEDAGIKLASVASDVLGASGRAMLDQIVAGRTDPAELAELARRRMRGKIPQLREALAGRPTEHHRFMLGELLEQVRFVESRVARVEERIDEQTRPLADAVARLDTIPGVDVTTAQALAAEIGVNMEQFPSARHLASWAGICPGNHESAGKRKSGKTRKGSRWLRRALCQAAWAASHTKETYLREQYRRLLRRRGKKRALVAVAHSILAIAWHLLKRNLNYIELGADYFDRLSAEEQTKRLVRRLQKLGHKVMLDAA